MTRTRRMLLALLAAVMLAVFAAPAATAAPQDAAYEAGASIGIWLPGTIDIDGFDFDKDAGFLLRAFADMYVAPKFAVGAYFNYTSSEVEGLDATSVEFGMALKPRFFLSPDISVKPGLNIGYRNSSIDIPASDNVDGLAVNLSVELQYHLGTGLIPFLDIGFLSQPTGGNSDSDVTWAPIFYINFGAAFGF